VKLDLRSAIALEESPNPPAKTITVAIRAAARRATADAPTLLPFRFISRSTAGPANGFGL
jgi:hypothetical protein